MRSGFRTRDFVVLAALLALPLGPGQAREGALLSEVAPGVVGVAVFSPEDRYPPRSGSGFVVDDKGLVVTSLRLLRNILRDNGVIELHTLDGEVRYAQAIVGTDKDWDLVLLKTKRFKGDALPLAGDDGDRVGQPVVAVTGGRPGQITSSVEGLVIRLLPHAGHDDLMQITNQITRLGNGGPVLSEEGEVVGLARSTSRDGLAVSLAVPVRAIRELVETSRADPDEMELERFSKEVQKKRSATLAARQNMERRCEADDIALIDRVLAETISSGAPIYDQGDHLGCYRLYEGASYKLLYNLEDRCETASELLEQFIADAHELQDDSGGNPSVQAWTLRYVFDALLGVPK